MRDGTGPLGTCLANVPRGDSAKPPCSLRARESPRPPGARPWAEAPAGDDHGDAQNETVSRETKSAPREAWLPGGTQVPACLTESSRRNSAAAVAPGKTVDPSLGPAGERLAGVPCGVGAAPVRDWLEGPRATNSHGGRCRKGEPGGPARTATRLAVRNGCLCGGTTGPPGGERLCVGAAWLAPGPVHGAACMARSAPE